MLPQLRKRSEQKEKSYTSAKNHISNLENMLQKDKGTSISTKKVRTGGGFRKNITSDDPIQQKNGRKAIAQENYKLLLKYQNSGDLNQEIKMIEKKIKACQKKIEEEKKKQKLLAEQVNQDPEKPQYDFEKVIRKQLQLQGYDSIIEEEKNFDYLTNPGGRKQVEKQQQVVEQGQERIVQKRNYNIDQGIQKLQKHYQNSLKRKFERREMFPHQACRRKTPKLYITQKNNALNKYGKVENENEHLFRVFTKETTPQEIYPTIPNFAVVKDNLSKNIIAYLGDYKPFLDKTKEGEKQLQNCKNNEDEIKAGREQVNLSPVKT